VGAGIEGAKRSFCHPEGAKRPKDLATVLRASCGAKRVRKRAEPVSVRRSLRSVGPVQTGGKILHFVQNDIIRVIRFDPWNP